MRILKYVILLLALVLLAFTVYVSTKDGDFNVTRSRTINLDKSTLFQYVNDYKNWEDFCGWKDENTKMTTTFQKNTVGVGASMSWEGNNEKGSMETIYLKENDSIAQKVVWNGNESDANITFKDTDSGTKVTWNSSGKLNFLGKLTSLFSGGIENSLGSTFDKRLENIEKVLSNEIKIYAISVDGVVVVTHQKYLKRKSESSIPEFYTSLQKAMPLLINFINNNGIKSNGSPFVIFDTYDIPNNKVKFSVATPLQEIIYTTPESEFTIDSIQPHQALKITLKGDYSHSKEAWDKGFEYIQKNNLEENSLGSYREIYKKSRREVKYPSQWITEIYIPVKTKD